MITPSYSGDYQEMSDIRTDKWDVMVRTKNELNARAWAKEEAAKKAAEVSNPEQNVEPKKEPEPAT
jgi:hypothetical protein